MAVVEILVLFLTVIALIWYTKRKYSYWEKRQVPYKAPTFPFGNIQNPLVSKGGLHMLLDRFYGDFKAQSEKHFGFYFSVKPVYVPIDPEIIKGVMMKDFDHFVDRGVYYNEKDDPLSAHIFSVGGKKWRELRAKLTPTFTSGKLKTMFSTLIECTKGMQDFIEDTCVNGEALDIKNVLQRFTIDVIGSCAFGIECNSFKSESEFQKHGKRVFAPTALEVLRNIIGFTNRNLARSLGLVLIPKSSSKFFLDVVKETVNYRLTKNVRRNDMLQIVMDLQTDSKMALDFNELAAQAFGFFIAGFETSSTTMNFCLFELAAHEDLQNKVREEVKEVLAKHGNEFTYDAIMNLKYMQQVIDETLRKYPPLMFITRECVKNYQIPNTNTLLEKGTVTMIPVFPLQRDPEHFPEPEKFDPERFSLENKHKITPFTYLPFGEGPRVCIGMRFGLMQTKIGLATLLKDYQFTVNERTKVPLEWDYFSFILATETPIWLDVKKIEQNLCM